jgi:uncharacterized repeat protein (TIGR04076 family)
MGFKVRARVVAILGDEEKYPCHMQHKIGDEIIFDGEKYIGRLCPVVWPLLVPKVSALYAAGPRYVDPAFYFPFWYAPPSVHDPSRKIYDGLGFRTVFQTHEAQPYSQASLLPPDAFKWPPHPERNVAKEISVVCPDARTSVVFMLEPFDLSDKGFDVPYFRRQMLVLDRVLKKQGIPEAAIVDLFSKEERYDIYPPLVSEILYPLDDELVIMDYMERKDGNVSVTKKGEARLEEFKRTLTAEERSALKL